MYGQGSKMMCAVMEGGEREREGKQIEEQDRSQVRARSGWSVIRE